MDPNKALGLAFLLTAAANFAVMRYLGDKLPPVSRVSLPMFGIIFGLLGLAALLGIAKLVQ